MRINRYLALVGVASRRAADRLITAGRVRLNGAQVTELGVLVLPGRDQVEVDGVLVGPVELPRYFMLHKPRGVVTTAADPQGRPTVLDLLGDETGVVRVFPVGRLDFDSEGVLLLTNDGTLAHRLLHPRYHVAKRYRVWTETAPRRGDLEQLAAGVEIEPGIVTRPALVEPPAPPTHTPPAHTPPDHPSPTDSRLAESAPPAAFEIEIREGKKRQVRRMCEALGMHVTRLVRVRFGPLELGGLPSGMVRPLSAEEIKALEIEAGLPDRKRRAGTPAPPSAAQADSSGLASSDPSP